MWTLWLSILWLVTFQPEDACIAVIGDSVAHGTAVVQVPGVGFPVIQTPTLAETLDAFIPAQDYSVPATSLRDGYFETAQYQTVTATPCHHALIVPFMNDIATPETYAADLSRLIDSLPVARVVLMGVHPIAPNALTDQIYDGAITPSAVARADAAIAPLCSSERVQCWFWPGWVPPQLMVLQAVTQTTYERNGYRPFDPATADLLAVYWRDNPDGLIVGDGLHLSTQGKRIITLRVMLDLWLSGIQ
jgi:hypothetical protein